MQLRVRWLKDECDRRTGQEEINDDDLCRAWQSAGFVEVLGEAETPQATVMEQYAGSETGALDAPAVDRMMRKPRKK